MRIIDEIGLLTCSIDRAIDTKFWRTEARMFVFERTVLIIERTTEYIRDIIEDRF